MRTFMKNRQHALMVLLVIAVVVYLVVDIAYRLIELNTPPPAPEPQAAAGAPAADMTKDPLEAYAVIVERNLFRTTDRPIVVDQMDPNSLEATTLQLDLYGTIAGDDGRGYAIIEERDKKKQRLYKVGDRVAGATIVKILRNAVVLRVGERDQVLKKKEIASAESRSQASGRNGPVRRRHRHRGPRPDPRPARRRPRRARPLGPGKPPDPGPCDAACHGWLVGQARRGRDQRNPARQPFRKRGARQRGSHPGGQRQGRHRAWRISFPCTGTSSRGQACPSR